MIKKTLFFVILFTLLFSTLSLALYEDQRYGLKAEAKLFNDLTGNLIVGRQGIGAETLVCDEQNNCVMSSRSKGTYGGIKTATDLEIQTETTVRKKRGTTTTLSTPTKITTPQALKRIKSTNLITGHVTTNSPYNNDISLKKIPIKTFLKNLKFNKIFTRYKQLRGEKGIIQPEFDTQGIIQPEFKPTDKEGIIQPEFDTQGIIQPEFKPKDTIASMTGKSIKGIVQPDFKPKSPTLSKTLTGKSIKGIVQPDFKPKSPSLSKAFTGKVIKTKKRATKLKREKVNKKGIVQPEFKPRAYKNKITGKAVSDFNIKAWLKEKFSFLF